MNVLKLKEATQMYVIYFYQPEGKGSYGEIKMNIGEKEAVIVSRSDEDGAGRYAFNAALAVEERVGKRNFPLEFTQAWY